MLNRRLDSFLHKYRIVLSVTFLLTIVYFALYTWLVLPPLVLFLGWQPDTEMRVLPFVVEEEYSLYVQTGDVVLAIDERPVRRGQTVFATPIKPLYELTLQRGETIFHQEIPIGERRFYNVWVLSQAVLSLAIWFIGYLTVQFTRPEQSSALYTGLSFQLIAAGIASPGPSQLGAPGAWIIGHVLIVYFPLIMLYLAFAPGEQPLRAWSRKLLKGSFFLLTLLAILAVVEVFFLFPESSIESLIGVRLFTIIATFSGLGIVLSIAILLGRLISLPQNSYERQQLLILFTFLALALIPLFVFVILPLDFFVPFPFVYSLFLLAPTGYFFVLHRQGFLQLDLIFSRIITVVISVLAVSMAYGLGIYMLETVFRFNVSSVGHGTFALLLVGTAVSSQRQVQTYVDLLLYGRDLFGPESIQAARIRLSASPEPATINQVLAQITAHLQLRQAVVLVKSENQLGLLTGNSEAFTVAAAPVYENVLLRARDADAGRMADLPEWVALSLPIMARGDMLGLLLLSRPVSGYFNARQVAMLQDIADILAFGLLIISLLETMHELSRQALFEKEVQRQRIATEIHNETLHTLTAAMIHLQSRTPDEAVPDTVDTIRKVVQDLRRIVADLRPPVLKESIEWIARQTVRSFAERHDHLQVVLHEPDIRSGRAAPEQTKIVFYNILIEALNNISKHAQATKVEVWLCYDDCRLTLEVRDNGIGAKTLNHSLTDLLRAHHIGLADMHRWALLGGGELLLTANLPSGTAVQLTLPTTLPETSLAMAYQ
jgi:signal transduction histidine kinase